MRFAFGENPPGGQAEGGVGRAFGRFEEPLVLAPVGAVALLGDPGPHFFVHRVGAIGELRRRDDRADEATARRFGHRHLAAVEAPDAFDRRVGLGRRGADAERHDDEREDEEGQGP